MIVERILRGVAGFFILLSVALAHYVSPYWLWFTAFVGLNLLQSAFTNWCPLMAILRACGVGASCPAATAPTTKPAPAEREPGD